MLPSARPTLTWPPTSGRRPSLPSLLTKSSLITWLRTTGLSTPKSRRSSSTRQHAQDMIWWTKKQLEFPPKVRCNYVKYMRFYHKNDMSICLISHYVWIIVLYVSLHFYDTWFGPWYHFSWMISAIVMCTFHPQSKIFSAWSGCILATTFLLQQSPK